MAILGRSSKVQVLRPVSTKRRFSRFLDRHHIDLFFGRTPKTHFFDPFSGPPKTPQNAVFEPSGAQNQHFGFTLIVNNIVDVVVVHHVIKNFFVHSLLINRNQQSKCPKSRFSTTPCTRPLPRLSLSPSPITSLS